MTALLTLVGINLCVVLAMMAAVWCFSIVKRDASLVDRFWGIGFILVAWSTYLQLAEHTVRALVLVSITTLWGLRLSLHITVRNWRHGEDARYVAMRQEHPKHFALWSFFAVFMLQGILVVVIGSPLQLGQGFRGVASWDAWVVIGSVIAVAGLLCEAVADWQLVVFRNNPKNSGGVLNSGLWRYSRHPNYFGDALMWWGLYCIAVGGPWAVWSFYAPLLMTFFLLKVSGVALLEKTIVERRGAYAEYVRKTSAFVPWFPKS